VRVAFALDCCDREAMSFLATTGGISGNDVQDLMVAAGRRASLQPGQSLAGYHRMAVRKLGRIITRTTSSDRIRLPYSPIYQMKSVIRPSKRPRIDTSHRRL
jgi:hypothetical protein